MRSDLLQIVLTILFILTLNLFGQSESWQYLEQVPPEKKPSVFASDLISGVDRLHSYPAISQDGKSILWMKLPPKIYSVEYKYDHWSQPEIFPALRKYMCLRPVFSEDNKRIYFSSGDIPGGKGNLDIWYIEKNDTGYTSPVNLGSPINTENIETGQSFTSNGNIYFTGFVEGKRWNRGLLYAEFRDGNYTDPMILDKAINIIDTNAVDYLSYVAPDESFLLFCSNRADLQKEDCRIYISYWDEQGGWDNPINLSEFMGFNQDSRDPYISPDGKYLFFSSGQNIYWVSAGIIEKLKAKVVQE